MSIFLCFSGKVTGRGGGGAVGLDLLAQFVLWEESSV